MKYLTSECNYGGRVTDDKDRRLINVLMDTYYNDLLISDEDYMFTPFEEYKVPRFESYDDCMNHISNKLPFTAEPEVFGFHKNANITKDLNETQLLFTSIIIA